MLDRIIAFLEPFMSPPWGYLIVFVGTFLENSVGAGVVVPGETLVLLGGVYSSELGHLWLPLTAFVAVFGAVLGDNVGYFIGRHYGRSWVERHGHRLFVSKERLKRADEYYRSHGGKTVFLGRFIPFVRSVGFIIAGISGMEWRRFLVYDIAGATIWGVGHTVIGYALGRSYRRWQHLATPVGLGVLALLVLLIGGSKFLSFRRRLKAETREG